MRIAGVVILFYPEENVIENILSYCSATEKIYIFDNSESPSENIISALKNIPNIQYYHDGKNEGIAVRLNETARFAIEEKYEWLLTMDQDSRFTKENLEHYFNCISDYVDKKSVSMFGVEYDNNAAKNEVCNALEVNHLITSGSVLNLSSFSTTQGFDERLFIDEVDLDYCLQSLQNGYKIIKFKNVFLGHHLGNISYHRSLKNLKITPRTLHSPLRIYYMVRNNLYLSKKYKRSFKNELSRSRKTILNRVKNNLFYGKNKNKIDEIFN